MLMIQSIVKNMHAKKKEVIIESLKVIFKDKILDLEDRIIPINLIKDIENGIIKAPEFGLDDLFYKIYSIFNKYIENFVKSKTMDKINFMKQISENKLFSELTFIFN